MDSITSAVSHTVEKLKELVLGHPEEEQQKTVYISGPSGFQENKVVTEEVEVQKEELPAVIHETRKFIEREEIQPIVHRDREETEIHLAEKEINESSVRATKVIETTKPAQFVEFKAKGAENMNTLLEQERALYQNTVEVAPSTHTVVTKPPIVEEVIHKKIIKEVQPIINRETIAPVVYKETLPIYEKIVEAPKIIHEREQVNRGLVSAPELPSQLKANEVIGFGKNVDYGSSTLNAQQYDLQGQGEFSSGGVGNLGSGLTAHKLVSPNQFNSNLAQGSQFSSGLGNQYNNTGFNSNLNTGLSSGLSSGNQYSNLGGNQYSSGWESGSQFSTGGQYGSMGNVGTTGLSNAGLGSGPSSGIGLSGTSLSGVNPLYEGSTTTSGLNTGFAKEASTSSKISEKRKEGQQFGY